MHKYVFIKGTLEKVKVGQSTYENYVQKGLKFYSSPEEAYNSRILERPFNKEIKFKPRTFNDHKSNNDRGKYS